MVFRAAYRILGHADDAEDVVQEVFLAAHRLRRTRAVRSWPGLLRRLAACRALDRLRQRRPLRPLDGLCLPGGEAGPEAVAIGHELAERLRAALAALPEREAAVFCLRYFEELSYQQIADALHVSPGAVGVALHKARAKLEGRLAEVVEGE
jgi:RNA polymerase sigma-70 factor (ECF subfamily)